MKKVIITINGDAHVLRAGNPADPMGCNVCSLRNDCFVLLGAGAQTCLLGFEDNKKDPPGRRLPWHFEKV